jgi:hypothetical protein
MVPERYSLGNLRAAVQNPRKFTRELFRISTPILKWTLERAHGQETDVLTEDWDNLVIVDACQYDHFRKHPPEFGDRIGKIVSRGSTSQEFMDTTFCGETLHDTVYVFSNPKCERIGSDVFFLLKKTYSDDMPHRYAGAVPDKVTEIATETHEKYPNKRLIVHYMQPHAPYLGDFAQKLRDRVTEERGVKFGYMTGMQGKEKSDDSEYIRDLRTAAAHNYITREGLERAQIENMELVLDHIDEELLPHLDGKTAITADHGELLGKPSVFDVFGGEVYGHPRGVYLSELRVVPWLEIDCENRKNVIAESPLGDDTVDRKSVENQLKALGYM